MTHDDLKQQLVDLSKIKDLTSDEVIELVRQGGVFKSDLEYVVTGRKQDAHRFISTIMTVREIDGEEVKTPTIYQAKDIKNKTVFRHEENITFSMLEEKKQRKKVKSYNLSREADEIERVQILMFEDEAQEHLIDPKEKLSQSNSEDLLWKAGLKNIKGMIQQMPIEGTSFLADYGLPDYRIVIESDSWAHHYKQKKDYNQTYERKMTIIGLGYYPLSIPSVRSKREAQAKVKQLKPLIEQMIKRLKKIAV